MPTALPALAAWLQRGGHQATIIDGLGEGLSQRYRPAPGLVARGLTPDQLVARVGPDVELAALSVHSVATDTVALQTIALLRRRPGLRLAVGGAHPSLSPERFLEAGADWVVRGEGERALARIAEGLEPVGLVQGHPLENPDDLPFPAVHQLPLQAYWSLRLGHGPVQGPYLNLSTSRGCAHGCRFCATPALVRRRWRGLSAQRTVDLLAWAVDGGVREFHFEDDNFTEDPARVHGICEGILSRGLELSFTLPSGVRSEHLDGSTLRLLAAAGCRYLSLAPENGSPRLLRAMAKSIDLEALCQVAEQAVHCGIRVGCFLVVGFPGETALDRQATARLVDRLIRLGVVDLSIFIWSPLPGAATGEEERGYRRLEQLCWTPRWRAQYGRYEGARWGLYLRALHALVRHRPWALMGSARRIALGRYETKGEMTLNRMLRWRG
jgi:radical SAM superfamily enzyme YgiQ (UPF0313 family)